MALALLVSRDSGRATHFILIKNTKSTLFTRLFMKFKSLILSIFLIPFALFGNCTKTQLIELKFKKEMELSDLGKAIAEKYRYCQSIRQDAINILNKEAYKKGLGEQEITEFGKMVDQELDSFVAQLNNVKNVNGFLTKELFKKSEDNQLDEDFEAVKFFLIIIINEYRIIKTLIQKYEVLEQERREINQKLIDFQQR